METAAPLAASISKTSSFALSVTQTSVPSELMPVGWPSRPIVWTKEPSDASSVTVFDPLLATQTWVPSAATATGAIPTAMLCTNVPFDVSSLTEL